MLSTSESIEKAFKQAELIQNNISQNSENNIVVLVLDEIGLAEVYYTYL